MAVAQIPVTWAAHQEDPERGLVAGLLHDSSHIDRILKAMDPRDVTNATLQTILSALVELHESGHDLDIEQVARHLQHQGKLDQVGGAVALGELFDEVLNGTDVLDYAKRVRQKTLEGRRRRLYAEASQDRDPELRERIAGVEDELDALESGTPRPGAVRILTAAEVEADEVPEALIWRLFYKRSLHNVVGASKAGKSLVVTQAAMCMATGRPFLGLPTRPSRVLFVNLEMSAALVRDRMERIARDVGIPMPELGRELFLVAPTKDGVPPEIDLRTEAGRRTLRDLIAESQADVVILDTLYCFAPGADPGSNAEMGALFRTLSLEVKLTGAAFIVIDHVSKGEASGEFSGPIAHSAIGAVTKGGACNVIAKLSKKGPAWTLEVDSHFGSWDDPLYYGRPETADGPGMGAVPTTPTEARNIDLRTVCRLFWDHGDKDDQKRPCFSSQTKLIAAIQAASWTSNNDEATALSASVQAEHAVSADAPPTKRSGKAIYISVGPRNAKVLTWVIDPEFHLRPEEEPAR